LQPDFVYDFGMLWPCVSPTPPTPATSPSLAETVRQSLLADLDAGRLRPGQRINEPDVAARHGVSRVPVREALRALQGSGLVVSRPHAGMFVRQLEPHEVADLLELRALYDGLAAAKAAALPVERRAPLVAYLLAQVAVMAQAASASDTAQANTAHRAFHAAIAAHSGNAQLAQRYTEVVHLLGLACAWPLGAGVTPSTATGSSRHAAGAPSGDHPRIARAIERGQVASAQRLALEHAASDRQALGLP
jgi:DNA-binding GntR family transcriptional regulator